MYVCVVNRQGDVLLHQNIKHNDWQFFLRKIQPFRHDLTITCECLFCWYWLADACARENLPFVLAHALYLRAIHGGKHKNDRIDSEKLARLLAAHLIPISYVYPAAKRPVRALLRQRLTYVWRRSELLMRIQSMQLAEGHEPVPRGSRNRDPWEARLIERYPNVHHQVALKTDLATVRHYDRMILDLEGQLVRTTRKIAGRDYALLQTVPGIGQALALTILYEVEDIHRFATVQRFSSYCRLVKGTVASGGTVRTSVAKQRRAECFLSSSSDRAEIVGSWPLMFSTILNPPGFSTRPTSRRARSSSGMCSIVSNRHTRSNEPSANGRCSLSALTT
jgi:transposase